MKKRQIIVTILTVTVLAMALIACASKPAAKAAPKALKGVPDFVNDAYLEASEDVLIGIGTYKTGGDPAKIGTGKTFAETRARADIARQMESIVKNMVTDYTAQSELDPKAAISFQENITQALAKASLKGARTTKMQTDDNGVLWIVMEYSKSLAAQDFNAAQAAAKLAVPAAVAFNALDRMEKAFGKDEGGGPNPLLD
jgi:hypothetical protein